MSPVRTTPRKVARLASGWALFFAATLPVRGQCPLPDGFDGGTCWTTATPTLPVFPMITTDVRNLTWLDCVLVDNGTANLEISRPRQARDPNRAPTPIASYYFSTYTIDDGAGTVLWSGRMWMAYARTWHETAAAADYQVWRFLINGDLVPTAAAGPSPSPVPVCAASFNGKVHFTGYVDYARDCETGTFFCAGAFTHEGAGVDHSGAGPRSGSFHSDRSFDFVWPAAGFAVETTNEFFSNFGIATGALRPLDWSVVPASSAIEVYESPFPHAATAHWGDKVCPSDVFGPLATYRISLSVTDSPCGIQTYSNPPTVTTLFCRALGKWTNPDRFPGAETVLLVRGYMWMNDPLRPRSRDEFFRGVMTRLGYGPRDVTASGLGDGLYSDMLDLGNELGFPPNMAHSRNVKFISDFIISANIFM